jgi:hypothetical protein
MNPSATGPVQRPSLALMGAEPLRAAFNKRTDGVVAWQTCRHEERSKRVHDIEVDSSQIDMGWNREVLDAVTDRLGQAPGPWRRYVRAN